MEFNLHATRRKQLRAFIASFLAVAVATAWANVETRQGSHKGEQKGRTEAAAAWIHQMAGPGRVRHSDGPLAVVPALDTVAGIRALQVTNGPLHGAFVMAPYGYVNWYFAASALIHFTDDIPDEAAAFVDAYLRHLEPDGTIVDYVPDYWNENGGIPRRQSPDSHDSYAAMLVALASKLGLNPERRTWFTQRKDALKWIVARNILDSQNPETGLVRTFQDPNQPDWCPGVEYLMDNCEVFQGLRLFAEALEAAGDPGWATMRDASDRVVAGIRTLFRTESGAWAHASQAAEVGTMFYPFATGQAFPVAFEVPVEPETTDAGWTYLENAAPLWWKGGRYDHFPWFVLGHAAALRGDRDAATTQLNSGFKYIRANPLAFTIAELGYWHATVRAMNS